MHQVQGVSTVACVVWTTVVKFEMLPRLRWQREFQRTPPSSQLSPFYWMCPALLEGQVVDALHAIGPTVRSATLQHCARIGLVFPSVCPLLLPGAPRVPGNTVPKVDVSSPGAAHRDVDKRSRSRDPSHCDARSIKKVTDRPCCCSCCCCAVW